MSQYFLSPLYLKQNTPVGDSVDDQLITPMIRTSAENYVRPLLGTFFFNDLLTKYNAQTLNPDEEILVADYLKTAIVWRTASELVYSVGYKIRNKGVQVESGEFSQPADGQWAAQLIGHYRKLGENYEHQMTKWLIDNKALFPALTDVLNTDSLIKNTICSTRLNTFNSNIFFI
jgi:hypothetical protein